MSLKKQYESVPSDAQHYFQNYDRDWLLRCTTSHYDPIFTPIIGSFFSAAFAATALGHAVIGGLAAIATTAVSIGIQMLLAPKPPKPEDGKVPRVQSIPFRQWGVGRNRVAGAFMLWEAKGKMLYGVQAIAGHPIKAVNRYFLHDDEVEVDPTTHVATGQNYRKNVRLYYRLGSTPGVPYDDIVTPLTAESIWTSNHRGDGQASIAMICESDKAERNAKTFPYGPPQFSVEADMALCWDFRDPSQDPEDPTTWEFTQNSALIMAWHQCFNEFGHRRDYKRAILPLLDMWQEEADVCDEFVALNGGGFERRYECNGFDTAENDPKAATNAILASCDGWICERGDGALLFIVGKFREKYVTTLTDADIVGVPSIEYDVLFEDEINRLIPKFTYPQIGYGTSDTDFFEDTTAQITAGRVLAQDAVYQWVQQWRQARRLGKRDWLRLLQKIRGQINVRLSGINSIYSRWIRMNTPILLPRLNGALVENRKSVLSLLQGGFTMDFTKHPANIDAWNPATDEGQQPPVPPKTDPGETDVPVINLVQAKSNGQTVYIRVVIVDPVDESLTPMVRYRLVMTDSGNAGAWVELKTESITASGGYIDLSTNVVPSDEDLEIQAAFTTSDGDHGDWSISVPVRSTVYPNPPQDVTDVSATASSTAGQVVFNWTSPNDDSYAAARVYWNTVNSFSGATQFTPPKYSGPAVAQSYRLTGLSAGVRYGFIVSLNKSHIPGNPIATGPFTVV